MLGGLPRKSYQLELAREENPTLLALDAGALLFKTSFLNPGIQLQELAAARAIAAAYRSMAYDAVGINALDLAAGLDFLRQIEARGGPAWLSADLIDPASGERLFTPGLLIEREGRKFGIIALTGQLPPDPATATPATATEEPPADSTPSNHRSELALLPWSQALPELVADFSARSEMVILLSGLEREENRLLAEQFPQIHLILLAGRNTDANLRPTLVNNSLLTAVGRQGKRLGLLEITWSPDRIWFDHDLSQLQEQRARLDNLNWQWRSLQRSREFVEPEPGATGREEEGSEYQRRMAAYEEEMQQEIKALEKELADLERGAGQRRTAAYESRFVALGKNQPEDPAMERMVKAAIGEINEIGRLQAAERRRQPGDQGDDSPYLGWQACAQCHQPQVNNWQQTRHAGAYTTLEQRQRQYDLNCLFCHITGDHRQNDARALFLPPSLQGVGCEVCHGPGREHLALMSSPASGPATLNKRVTRHPEPTTCLTCHTPEQSPNFNYSRAIKQLNCP